MVGFFRDSKGSFGGGRGFRRKKFNRGFRREMHKATCAECGKECEVPFKPKGDRPVYCLDCFKKRKGSEGTNVPKKEEAEETEKEEMSKDDSEENFEESLEENTEDEEVEEEQ